MDEPEKKLHAAKFSIAVNLFLIALKAVVALLTGSIAILAEFAHSLFDALASLLAYAGIREAAKPADEHHHYGHEKYENLSSLAQTVLIVITSALIIYEAVERIFHPQKTEFIAAGLFIMIVTIGVDFFISRYLHKSSKEYESTALEADAYHFTTDLWGAVAVIAGLGFVLLGYPVFDSVAAIVVAILMLYISYMLGRKSISALMDRSPSEHATEKMCTIIAGTRGVSGFHKFRARQAGSKMFVDVHIHVNPHITVGSGHKIAHKVKENLVKEFPGIKEVNVHVEPNRKKE